MSAAEKIVLVEHSKELSLNASKEAGSNGSGGASASRAVGVARVRDLDIEVESLSREMSTSRKQYQIVELGFPQRSCRRDTVSRIDLDAVTSQDAGAHIASALAGIDEENFLVIEN